MSSLPCEVLEDVLRPLDRSTLDDAQFTDRRFLQLIMERMSDVCFRLIDEAVFTVPCKKDAYFRIAIDSRPERKIRRNDEDVILLFSEFLRALRSSRVRFLTLGHVGCKGLVITAAMATLVLETPIIAHQLTFASGSYTELTPTEFRELVVHFSPSSVNLEKCDLRPSQISDDFLRALFKNGVRKTWIKSALPEQDEETVAFHVTDDAVVDFFAQENDPIGQEGKVDTSRSWRPELAIDNGSFTKDLFKRVVEASAASTRERPLRVSVSPVRFEEEDLRDFEGHFSGVFCEQLIYDFPDDLPILTNPTTKRPPICTCKLC